MGQRECLTILEEKYKWYTVQELQDILSIHSCSINESLSRLAKGGYIEKKRNPDKYHGFLYRIKK
jgi:predicted transcriptional regulator